MGIKENGLYFNEAEVEAEAEAEIKGKGSTMISKIKAAAFLLKFSNELLELETKDCNLTSVSLLSALAAALFAPFYTIFALKPSSSAAEMFSITFVPSLRGLLSLALLFGCCLFHFLSLSLCTCLYMLLLEHNMFLLTKCLVRSEGFHFFFCGQP